MQSKSLFKLSLLSIADGPRDQILGSGRQAKPLAETIPRHPRNLASGIRGQSSRR